MKLHSEISISRIVLYTSLLVTLAGGNFSEKDLPKRIETNGSQNAISDEYSRIKTLQDSVRLHPIMWGKYGLHN